MIMIIQYLEMELFGDSAGLGYSDSSDGNGSRAPIRFEKSRRTQIVQILVTNIVAETKIPYASF